MGCKTHLLHHPIYSTTLNNILINFQYGWIYIWILKLIECGCAYSLLRLNSIRTQCKIHVLPLLSQHGTSSYHIFKNKHNYTQSILIPIYKSNHIGNLLRCYQVWQNVLDGIKDVFYTPSLQNLISSLLCNMMIFVGVKGQATHIYVYVRPRAQSEDSK